MMMKFALMSALLSIVVGCKSTQTYEVSVHNLTARPITLWLTKDGGSAEQGWVSPEQLLAARNGDELDYDKADVPPGKTGYIDKISGHFDKGVHAILRVYRGDQSLDEILRDTKSQLPRVDYPLTPGKNHLAVTEQDDRILVRPAIGGEMPPPKSP